MKSIVMKFGGAAVATPEHFSRIAEIIAAKAEEYPHIAVVVSAMGKTTNELIDLAHRLHPSPPKREYDMLLTVGERISIALLAMALELKGIQAISFTGSQSGIITDNQHGEAKIVDVRPKRILNAFEKKCLAIVAGFQGVSLKGEITTLGRGGSDTTAVAMGVALQAEKVEFYKDVKGIYSSDPHKTPDAQFYSKMSYGDLIELLGKNSQVMHPRGVSLAKRNQLPLHILPFKKQQNDPCGTWIGEELSDQSGILKKQLYEN